MTERDEIVLLEIFRNEIRWYHFQTPEARNVVTDRVRTDVVRKLADAGRVDIGTAAPGAYSVPSLITDEAPGSTSPEPGPRPVDIDENNRQIDETLRRLATGPEGGAADG